MATTKAPTKSPARKAPQKQPTQPVESANPQTRESVDHPAGQAIPLPSDDLATSLQEEQDDLQQPGRVARGLADQIDNSPGYSKDQLAHMKEYWGDGPAVGEDDTNDE